MKVAVLWTRLSGYMNACLHELAQRSGVALMACHEAPHAEAPFEEAQFAWIERRHAWKSKAEMRALPELVRAFDPDVVLVPGWHLPVYRQIARERRGRSLRIMGMDNCWLAHPRQVGATLIAPWMLHPLAEMVWLPGERQAVFARKLGFRQEQILRGLYACDRERFAERYEERKRGGKALPQSFLFVGRFVPDKGIDVLAEAYRLYRERVAEPWPLVCCGTGELRPLLEGHPGVRVEGFVQPQALPEKLAGAGCFVLPSRFEPWAVALQEAASAGLILLASEKVGSAVHLVQPGHNGFIVTNGDSEGLAGMMTRVSQLTEARREAMAEASYRLSGQFTPERWADTLMDAYARFETARGERGAG